MILLDLAITVFIFIKAVEFVYHFQIKEYRWDRLWSFLKEEGIVKTIYFSAVKLPAKTPRNFLITLILLILSSFLFIHLQLASSFILVVTMFLSPLIAFIFTYSAVFLTAIPVSIYRKRVISQASNLVNGSSVIGIGITGTYGKSSVKEFLYHLLSTEFKVAKTDKNMNTDLGIALSILKNLKKDTQYFIAEFGAYKLGEIENATNIIKPKISILTGLGNQHIDLYGSKKNLITAETYLLKISDTNYINADFPHSKDITAGIKHKTYYSILSPEKITATDIIQKTDSTEAIVIYNGQTFPIKTQLLGHHNILNLLPGIAIARDLGISVKRIQNELHKLSPIPGKLSLHTGPNGSKIINDSYNSNVEGFIAAIQSAKLFSHQKKYIVTRGIIELGVEKRSSYKQILTELYKTNIKLITTDDEFMKLDTQDRVETLNDVNDIKRRLLSEIDSSTLVILEGRFSAEFVSSFIQ